MFRRFDNFVRNEFWVTLVFEQVRNFGFIGVLFSAAAWKETHLGNGWLAIWDHLVSAILFPAALALLWLNHQHLFHKIRGAPASRWLKRLFAVIYFVLFSELFRYVLEAKLSR